MFEIMAMERPIIASVKGESANILARSEAALVVEPENSRAIADAIVRLHANPQERQVMSAKGRRFVADHYSRRSLAAKYLHVLNEAIADYTAARK
jgi:glycosyltransferase involved in cell wall biosynthesis